jgi:hypothetical protein
MCIGSCTSIGLKNSKDLLLKYKDKLLILNFKKQELIEKTFLYWEYLNLIK